ncbi:hypothetical protein PAEPH01_2546 [Pancytospora epiphaga]|nr:hypothetical protein PAEPH01_2546 [Pancytospora epiphaga]
MCLQYITFVSPFTEHINGHNNNISKIFGHCKILQIFEIMKINFSGAEDESLNMSNLVLSKEEFQQANIKSLNDVIAYIHNTEPRAHKSFYNTDGTLANGTICLIDGQDAEMYEEEEQIVHLESNVVFISTLHGG